MGACFSKISFGLCMIFNNFEIFVAFFHGAAAVKAVLCFFIRCISLWRLLSVQCTDLDLNLMISRSVKYFLMRIYHFCMPTPHCLCFGLNPGIFSILSPMGDSMHFMEYDFITIETIYEIYFLKLCSTLLCSSFVSFITFLFAIFIQAVSYSQGCFLFCLVLAKLVARLFLVLCRS